jgi:cobalt-zinc-cadmium efflux system protein
MLVIAVIGLVFNLVVAFVLGGHEHEHDHEGEDGAESHEEAEDLNVRSAFLHVVGDAVSSVGVIIAAGVIWFTGWEWVDPLMSVFIGIIIVLSSWRVLKSSLHILIEGVLEHLSVEKIGVSMAGVPGVLDVHDLHVWSICSGHVALSAHVITADQTITDGNGIMTELKGAAASIRHRAHHHPVRVRRLRAGDKSLPINECERRMSHAISDVCDHRCRQHWENPGFPLADSMSARRISPDL